MDKPKNSSEEQESRNLGVTVVSGMLALTLGGFASSLIVMGTQEQFMYGVGIGILALLFLAIAIYGRKSFFKTFLEAFTWI